MNGDEKREIFELPAVSVLNDGAFVSAQSYSYGARATDICALTFGIPVLANNLLILLLMYSFCSRNREYRCVIVR